MSVGAFSAVLVVLVIVFIVGHAWFYIVERTLDRLKRLLSWKKESDPWHPFLSEQEEKEEKHG
ncbi:MAG: hypothetical protein LUK37_25885 [Clostridia bacterium]|nr:hypothetical protein [Clostridia bacterium]